MQTRIAFVLGREWKLSLAELLSRYSETAYREHSDQVAIFDVDHFHPGEFAMIGGCIRAIRIEENIPVANFRNRVIESIKKTIELKKGKEVPKPVSKFRFAIASYGNQVEHFDLGMQIKRALERDGIESRFVNSKSMNIASALWKKEKLGHYESEYSLVSVRDNTYFGRTVACQDIDRYTRRDMGKNRDMKVGMLPPKLAQMMINLIGRKEMERGIYDPFVGLGTILIEAINMGYERTLGSDIELNMVESTRKSVNAFMQEERTWAEKIRARGNIPMKDIEKVQFQVHVLNAKNIDVEWKRYMTDGNHMRSLDVYDIVSEGYLGESMGQSHITLDHVKRERGKLSSLYEGFFHGLAVLHYSGTMVFSFPFWNLHGSYSYFSEIYTILERNGFSVIPLIPLHFNLTTSKGSLLYKREKQTVGREIVKIMRNSR